MGSSYGTYDPPFGKPSFPYEIEGVILACMHAQRTLLKLLYIQACDIRYLILQIEHNACLARCLQGIANGIFCCSVAVAVYCVKVSLLQSLCC